LAYSFTAKKWYILNTKNWQSTTLPFENMETPIFSNDNSRIYFTEKTKLWSYEIKTKKTKILSPKLDFHSLKFDNIKYRESYAHIIGINIHTYYLDKGQPIILKTSCQNNKQALYQYSEHTKWTTLIAPAPIKI